MIYITHFSFTLQPVFTVLVIGYYFDSPVIREFYGQSVDFGLWSIILLSIVVFSVLGRVLFEVVGVLD